MEETMSRILVGTFVKRMLKEIRESPERNTRNLVDMALQFSRGRFQQHFFGAAQTMLQKEDSGYYALVRDTVAWADLDRLYTFGMNLGYNGCTAGAQRIRENEKRLGCNIPWTILLELDTEGLDRTGPRYHALIREGEALGVFVWTLLTGERPALVLPLVKKHPDSAFFLFCAPGDVTPAFLDGAAEFNNLMAAVRYGEGAADACAALRKKGLLCSVWYQYGQKDTEAILNGKLFDGAQQLSPIFTILLPEPDCPAPVQRLAHQAVEQARMEQTYRTALWEAQGDNRKVDTVISDDACAACFDRDGTIREWGRRLSCAPNNLFESGLTDLLTAAFPKKRE